MPEAGGSRALGDRRPRGPLPQRAEWLRHAHGLDPLGDQPAGGDLEEAVKPRLKDKGRSNRLAVADVGLLIPHADVAMRGALTTLERWLANRPRSGRLSRADRIVETRRLRERGLTQREIAERLDVSVSTVANDLRSTSSDGPPVTARSRSTPPPRTAQRADIAGLGKLLGPLRAVARSARRLLP